MLVITKMESSLLLLMWTEISPWSWSLEIWITKQIQTAVYYWGLKKQGRNFYRGQQMQCGLSVVWTRPRRLLPNNLMQPEQAVKEATRLPSPVNHRWQLKTHCSITDPRCTLEIQVADEHRAQGARAAGSKQRIDTTAEPQCTHHITNGGDVSDSHLVYSVPFTAIFRKINMV